MGCASQVLLGILVLSCKKNILYGELPEPVNTRSQADEHGRFSSSAPQAECLKPLLLEQSDEGGMIVDKV